MRTGPRDRLPTASSRTLYAYAYASTVSASGEQRVRVQSPCRAGNRNKKMAATGAGQGARQKQSQKKAAMEGSGVKGTGGAAARSHDTRARLPPRPPLARRRVGLRWKPAAGARGDVRTRPRGIRGQSFGNLAARTRTLLPVQYTPLVARGQRFTEKAARQRTKGTREKHEHATQVALLE